jgi:hypothetical protein
MNRKGALHSFSCSKVSFSAFQQPVVVDRIAAFLEQEKTLVRAPSRSNGHDVLDVVEGSWMTCADESGYQRRRFPESHRARKERGQPKDSSSCFAENFSRRLSFAWQNICFQE